MDNNVILFIIAYLAMINLYGYISCGVDKKRAQKGEWRIPEKRFFITAVLGGGPGVLAGMYKFRHKTKHMSFTLGIPAIIIAQCILLFLIWR